MAATPQQQVISFILSRITKHEFQRTIDDDGNVPADYATFSRDQMMKVNQMSPVEINNLITVINLIESEVLQVSRGAEDNGGSYPLDGFYLSQGEVIMLYYG